jgi:hypothetical protein
LFFVGLGIGMIYGARWEGRLWSHARRRGYDVRKLARLADRLKIRSQFKGRPSFERFLRRGWVNAVGYYAGGIAALLGAVVLVVGIPYEYPARLHVNEARLTVDYRWPRADREVPAEQIRGVEIFTGHWRGRRGAPRSRTDLRVSLVTGETLTIRPTGFAGSMENLRAAGAALAVRRGLVLGETVGDR